MPVQGQAGLQHGAHKVPVRHRVQTVARDLTETEFRGHVLTIHVECHAGQRPGAQRAHVRHGVRVQDSVYVAPVHLKQSQEVVPQRDRLRDLEVGESRRDGLCFLFGPVHQNAQQVQNRRHKAQAKALAVETEIRGDLVVATARHVQPAAIVADTRDQLPFNVAVHILIVRVRRRAARCLELDQQRIERRRQSIGAAGRNDLLAAQHRGVRAAGHDVLAVHPTVDGVRARKRAGAFRRRFVEPSTPHQRGLLQQPERGNVVKRPARPRAHPVLRPVRPG